ncbi:hypothetical protein CRENBAI_024259 [Crenichthys baileyi]|uniref:Uncharacterized protein n=1 Tax=Crenichthys baileyi TaxID=28760 RepID=A0AAV9QZ80_9TELE
MRSDGRSCLWTGNATISYTDRQQKQKESQIARQRGVGGNSASQKNEMRCSRERDVASDPLSRTKSGTDLFLSAK